MSPTTLARVYSYLRHSSSKAIRDRARRKIILSHIRLGMSIVATVAERWPSKTDVLVSEMFWQLAHATDMLAVGALDHHNPPNITAYLSLAIRTHLWKVCYKDRVRIGTKGVGQINGHEVAAKEDKSTELLELITSILKDDRERKIVAMRSQGFKDGAIADCLGVTPRFVCALRQDIERRFLEKFNE